MNFMDDRLRELVLKGIIFFASLLFSSLALAASGDDFLLDLIAQVRELLNFITYLSYSMGLIFMFAGIMKLKHERDKGQGANYHHALSYFILAMILSYLPDFINSVSMSVIKQESGFDAWGATKEKDVTGGATECYGYLAVALLLKLIGLVSCIRGAVIISKSTQQAGGSQEYKLSKGFIHFFGGIACINFFALIGVFQNTFGFDSIKSPEYWKRGSGANCYEENYLW